MRQRRATCTSGVAVVDEPVVWFTSAHLIHSRVELVYSIVAVETHRPFSLARAALPLSFLGFSCTDFS